MKLFYLLLVLCFVAGAHDLGMSEDIVSLYEYLETQDPQERLTSIKFIQYLIDHGKDITVPLPIEEEKEFDPEPIFSKWQARNAWRKIVSYLIERKYEHSWLDKLTNKKVII